MAKEGGPDGVRANVICPGFVKTPLVEKQIPEQAKELGISEERVVKEMMLGGTVDKNSPRLRTSPKWRCCSPASRPMHSPASRSSSAMAGI